MSQNNIIYEYLLAQRGEWIPMPVLYSVSGSMNIHSRASALRKRGITIENKIEVDPQTKVKKSYYRIP